MVKQYLFITIAMLLTLSTQANAGAFKNRYTLPHTESKTLKGVGTVTITLNAGEAIDTIFVNTYITCLDKRYNYKAELPRQFIDQTEICDFTGLEYRPDLNAFVIGYHALAEIKGPSKCDTGNDMANTVDLRVMCAALQPK
ncbi:MAG: hypothetical protein ACXVA9_09030 [Bdellovibrionales bacterium]